MSNKSRIFLSLFALSLISILVTGCEEKNSIDSWGSVQYAGALKNIMHKGDLSSNISLNGLDKENLYALGAMTNLKGEIQIFDGLAYNSFVDKDSVGIDNSFEKEAALLVYTHVESWDTIYLPTSIISRQDLENSISQHAKEKGIDTRQPFPFLLEGFFQSIDWHVINWKDGDTEHSHEKHVESGLYGTLHNTSAQMLGFYSKKHKGIFTHHTADTHIHFKLKNKSICGHVDNLEISNNMILKLPTTSN